MAHYKLKLDRTDLYFNGWWTQYTLLCAFFRFCALFALKHFEMKIFIRMDIQILSCGIPCGVNNRFCQQKSFCSET